MVGRKRKAGNRENNGRLQRERNDPALVAARMPHRAWIPSRTDDRGRVIDQRRDHKAENPFGRLCLVGSVTPSEYTAGQRFLTDYRRYRVVIDSPRESTPSLTGRLSRSDYSEGDAPIPLRIQKPMSDQEAQDRTKAYMKAVEAIKADNLGRPTPRHNLLVLNSVVIHERELQPGDREFLKAALQRLEGHYAKPVGNPGGRLTRLREYASGHK